MPPSGAIIATLLDTAQAQDWEQWHEDIYQFTLLVWDVHSGKLLAQMRLPFVERFVVVDDTHLIITTAEPIHAEEEGENQEVREYQYVLLVWNIRSNLLERKIELLERVEDLAVSTESTFFAAFFPRTTTIQCWRTADWTPSHAFEIEAPRGNLDAPGGTYQAAHVMEDLPRERKFTPWIGDYQASRFAFLNDHLLVFSSGKRLVEFDLQEPHGLPHSPFDHPTIPWTPLLHHRNAQREIAVLQIEHAYQFGESQVELAYLVPATENLRYSFDTSVQLVKRVPGAVLQPTILDEATILALVEYDTTYRWYRAYKTRVGLCNLVSGKVVMLSDGERLHGGDDQLSARISPKGDRVAYWVCPYKGAPRLTIQSLQIRALQAKQSTLSHELEKSRKRAHAQVWSEE